MNSCLLDILYTSTGSSEGCIPSPHLLFLYPDRHDCRSAQSNYNIVKFDDDIVLLSLAIHHHNSALQGFVKWFETLCLEVNIINTKEVIVTFTQTEINCHVFTIIQRQTVEIVKEYKYLGTIFKQSITGEVGS